MNIPRSSTALSAKMRRAGKMKHRASKRDREQMNEYDLAIEEWCDAVEEDEASSNDGNEQQKVP